MAWPPVLGVRLHSVRPTPRRAVDAPPASYAVNVATAADVGVDADQMRGLAAAIAPIVGTPRVVAAVGNIMRGLAIELAALDDME